MFLSICSSIWFFISHFCCSASSIINILSHWEYFYLVFSCVVTFPEFEPRVHQFQRILANQKSGILSLYLNDSLHFLDLQSATITDSGIKKFEKEVYNPIWMSAAIHWGILGLGCLLLIIAIVLLIILFVRKRKDSEESSSLITPVDAGDQWNLSSAVHINVNLKPWLDHLFIYKCQ